MNPVLTTVRPLAETWLLHHSHDDVIKWSHFPRYWPVTRSFDVFFDRRLNKRLRKQSWGWWIETQSSPFWRHCNEFRLWLVNFRPIFIKIQRFASKKMHFKCRLQIVHQFVTALILVSMLFNATSGSGCLLICPSEKRPISLTIFQTHFKYGCISVWLSSNCWSCYCYNITHITRQA